LLEAFLGEIRGLDARHLSTGRHSQLTFDEWHAMVSCANGMGHMYLSWNVQPMQNELIVHGTRGVMHVDCYLQTCTVRRRIPGPKPIQRIYAAIANSFTTIGSVTGNVFKMVTGRLRPSPGIHEGVRKFYLALRNGAPVPVPAEEGRRIVAWAEVATKGAEEAKRQLTQAQATPPAPARILVTGASGFLGGVLVARLVREGESPRVLLRKPSATVEALPGITAVYGDLGNPADVDRAVAGVDVVYHVGAAMGGSAADFECATVWGTRNVIDACLRHGVKKLVHVSSLSVLDHAGHARGAAVTELSALEPHPDWRGQYTKTKLIAEQLVAAAVRERGLRAVILRPGMIFGPGAKPSAPSGSIGFGSRWVVMGSGKLVLPLVYVDDVVDALLLAAREESAEGGVFQLVDGAAISQRQYINLARQHAGGKLRATYVPKVVFFGAAIAAEILGRLLKRSAPLTRYKLRSLPPLSRFDTSAARTKLRWSPAVGVMEGLRRTFSAAAASPAVASITAVSPSSKPSELAD
jgi:nucleoside-diphosphate-sugar epimerase